MKFKQSTVLGFFDSSQKHFVIPVYQRAYAWGEKQWSLFLNDLIEQAYGDNNYFYGNILLETVKMDIEYEVIDGQQRLTTLAIFIRSLLDVCAERAIAAIDVDCIEHIYLKNGGNIKLRPVAYDRSCFDAVIIARNDSFESSSPSQKRIIQAKKYFKDKLSNLSIDIIPKLLHKIETAEITCIEFENKKDSALMFELQNNRGKDLTNMEKLKSYFMYQIYTSSTLDETESNIEYISNIFKELYLIINDLKHIDEDSVLTYHCNAYINGYAYRTIEDIKAKYKKSDDKVAWIRTFSENLRTTFANMKKFESASTPYLDDIRYLKIPAFVYPFIVKGYKYLANDEEKLNKLFHILEVLIFRYRLINSRADIISRLNEVLSSFDGSLDTLCEALNRKLNDAWYWGDYRTEECLNGYMYENSVLHYLLWKYEESLQNRGYKVTLCKIENEQIEHISPQNPTNGEPLETGYEVDENNCYSETFTAEKLNSLGNLMLISGSHNASIGNKPFAAKLKTYKDNPLLKQQAEIATFTTTNTWMTTNIDLRHKKMLSFAKDKWSFKP